MPVRIVFDRIYKNGTALECIAEFKSMKSVQRYFKKCEREKCIDHFGEKFVDRNPRLCH